MLLGLEIAGNVIFYLVIIALFLFALFNINGGNGTENFPNIFGRGMLNVKSDSMDHQGQEGLAEWQDTEIKDGFTTGDLVFAKTFSDETTKDLKIGDVVVFVGKVNGETALVTHRVVDIKDDKTVVTQGDKAALVFSGEYDGNSNRLTDAYIAKGTARYDAAIASGMTDDDISAFNGRVSFRKATEVVDVSIIRGIATSVSVGSGSTLVKIQDNYLFYFVIPVAVLLIFEIFLVVRNIMILRGEKNKAELEGTREALMADVEAEKEKMRQELLAEMRAQGLVTDEVKTEEVKEDLPVESNEPVEEKTLESEEVKVDEEENSSTDNEEVKEEASVEEVSSEETKEE